VRKIVVQVGFVALPRRSPVEKFLARINRDRRLAKDFEATIDPLRAFLHAASITPRGRASQGAQTKPTLN
jgi:putative transposase